MIMNYELRNIDLPYSRIILESSGHLATERPLKNKRSLRMSQYGYSFKGKYFILGAIGILGLIFTEGWLQIIFGIYTFGCVIGAIKGDN